jgi:hypothetical protein
MTFGRVQILHNSAGVSVYIMTAAGNNIPAHLFVLRTERLLKFGYSRSKGSIAPHIHYYECGPLVYARFAWK